jgi:hypothetical protein
MSRSGQSLPKWAASATSAFPLIATRQRTSPDVSNVPDPDDPTAAAEIEARLASHGIDAASVNIEVFVQARDLFVMFDSLMHSAQSRRILLVREIAARRAVSRQARGTRISVSAL